MCRLPANRPGWPASQPGRLAGWAAKSKKSQKVKKNLFDFLKFSDKTQTKHKTSGGLRGHTSDTFTYMRYIFSLLLSGYPNDDCRVFVNALEA